MSPSSEEKDTQRHFRVPLSSLASPWQFVRPIPLTAGYMVLVAVLLAGWWLCSILMLYGMPGPIGELRASPYTVLVAGLIPPLGIWLSFWSVGVAVKLGAPRAFGYLPLGITFLANALVWLVLFIGSPDPNRIWWLLLAALIFWLVEVCLLVNSYNCICGLARLLSQKNTRSLDAFFSEGEGKPELPLVHVYVSPVVYALVVGVIGGLLVVLEFIGMLGGWSTYGEDFRSVILCVALRDSCLAVVAASSIAWYQSSLAFLRRSCSGVRDTTEGPLQPLVWESGIAAGPRSTGEPAETEELPATWAAPVLVRQHGDGCAGPGRSPVRPGRARDSGELSARTMRRVGRQPRGDELVRVEFDTGHVKVQGRKVDKNAPWAMLEYFLWKDGRVHWSEGYLIYRRWWRRGVKNPRDLFRRKKDEYTNILQRKFGVALEFEEATRDRQIHYWELVGHNLSTNISEAKIHYGNAARLFRGEDFAGARAELTTALAKYPNHLESYLLLVRCYEKQGFEHVSAEEADRVLRPAWDCLTTRSEAIQSLRRVLAGESDRQLQLLLSWVDGHPTFSQVEAHAEVLDKFLRENVFTEEERILGELGPLLKAAAVDPDVSSRAARIREFLECPWVQNVVARVEKGQDMVLRLFYAFQEEPDFTSKLKTMSRMRFRTVGQFQSYLRKTLEAIRKDAPRELVKGAPAWPRDVIAKAKEVDKLEAALCHELGRMPSEDELREAIGTKFAWTQEEIEDVFRFRHTDFDYAATPGDIRDPDDELDDRDTEEPASQ